jgi:hypothetical protein
MKRRQFITLIGGAAAWPLAARAQQPTIPAIGWMSGRSPEDSTHLVAAFHQGLREAGFVEGQNVSIEYRWARGQYEKLPALAAELVSRGVAVLIGVAGAAIAAKQATSTIPIVFGMGADPIKASLVESFNRPGGNATGYTLWTDEMEPKRVGLLHQLLPGIPLMGALLNAGPAAAKASGEVNFQISCGPAVQKTFKEAVWTLHSFWYPEALKGFTAVTEAEPGCAMGYWGIAMSHWYPLWFPPSPAALKAGAEAVEKAVAAGPKTEREKDYIAAIAAFYRDSDKLDHQTRAVAYEKAMEQVYLRYPEDREAAVFYGLALNASALPTDKTYANKRKAAEILNKVKITPASSTI